MNDPVYTCALSAALPALRPTFIWIYIFYFIHLLFYYWALSNLVMSPTLQGSFCTNVALMRGLHYFYSYLYVWWNPSNPHKVDRRELLWTKAGIVWCWLSPLGAVKFAQDLLKLVFDVRQMCFIQNKTFAVIYFHILCNICYIYIIITIVMTVILVHFTNLISLKQIII